MPRAWFEENRSRAWAPVHLLEGRHRGALALVIAGGPSAEIPARIHPGDADVVFVTRRHYRAWAPHLFGVQTYLVDCEIDFTWPHFYGKCLPAHDMIRNRCACHLEAPRFVYEFACVERIGAAERAINEEFPPDPRDCITYRRSGEAALEFAFKARANRILALGFDGGEKGELVEDQRRLFEYLRGHGVRILQSEK